MTGDSLLQRFRARKTRKFFRRGMDRIRKSLRFGGRKDRDSPNLANASTGGKAGSSGSRPQQWQEDEAKVRAGVCNFHVKYLGCVEVHESRGMSVCEEALKLLRAQRRRRVKGTLCISGDSLRLMDDEKSHGLILDQTVEKVSFCAPDRNNKKGFAYICREGASRRWMCHGFHYKDTGERLSHALGCAFAVCLENKQKREKLSSNCSVQRGVASNADSLVTENTSEPPLVELGGFDNTAANFQRQQSFRQVPLAERLQDPQNVIPGDTPPPVKPTVNPHAVSRPQGNLQLFERQGSLRLEGEQLPVFKRNFSLRVNELPSNLARHQPTGKTGALIGTIPEESEHKSYPQTKEEILKHFANSTPPRPGWQKLEDTPEEASDFNPRSEPNQEPISSRSLADQWLHSTLGHVKPVENGRKSTSPTPAQGGIENNAVSEDVFGQEEFNPLSPVPANKNIDPVYAKLQKKGSKSAIIEPDSEDFSTKWKALEKAHNNPFINAESSAVNV